MYVYFAGKHKRVLYSDPPIGIQLHEDKGRIFYISSGNKLEAISVEGGSRKMLKRGDGSPWGLAIDSIQR